MAQVVACQRMCVFENLLSTVVQAYYKSNYTVDSLCIETRIEPSKSNGAKAKNQVDKRNKAIHKTHRTEPRANKRKVDIEAEEMANQDYIDQTDILNYLVSPLKVDFEFGQLIRELVA